MRKCPHAEGLYRCRALVDNGFAQNTLTIPESWWQKFCLGAKYHQCSNLKAAVSMKQEKSKKTGPGTYIDKGAGTGMSGNWAKKQKKNDKKINAVHAHGGKTPHFCEKPWRSADLRFRVVNSEFYTRPWLP
ncbi:hypothetical protein Desca_0159 [Desulfotomaculum nigrificans CO-1-SRB]|uniref:Uncharacterized protein n=1 Tax=Desulfotomaculum nigrificans (strain DSM 14880 / VKM B-2319 / CO-1-SRB) TaxID=868595 RepID=F6B544_DESCC|nr:hypothetical protein [Desulfotomaculum nigrificans]AEF93063.1 hypothetical protein Desca_0159 [Desulfotomaculum nigrificans CO-1-SRB]